MRGAPESRPDVDGQMRVLVGGAALAPPAGVRGLSPLRDWLLGVAAMLPRGPGLYEELHGVEGLYMQRWVLASGDDGRLLMNRFLRSDEDLELHGHPWEADSLLVDGSYREERRVKTALGWGVITGEFHAGDINQINASTYHRVELITQEVWTLFWTKPKVQSWAFWHRDTGHYTPWREFLEAKGNLPPARSESPAKKAERLITLADSLLPSEHLEAARLRARAAFHINA